MTAQETALLNRIDVRPHGRTPLLDIVLEELEGEFYIDHRGYYYLFAPDGYWRIAPKFEDVMRHLNKRRKEQGRPQILTNPAWGAV